MRAVQYVHAHELDGAVAGEAARRRSTVGQEMKELEGSTGPVKFVAGMAGEVEAQRLVVVEDRGVYGAVHENEDGVGRGGDEGRLNVRQDEVVVRLENGASGHGRIEDDQVLLVVVDGLDLVVPGWGGEEQVRGGAV